MNSGFEECLGDSGEFRVPAEPRRCSRRPLWMASQGRAVAGVGMVEVADAALAFECPAQGGELKSGGGMPVS